MFNAEIGKVLIIIGIIAIVAGLIMAANIKIPFLGKLPGDIRVEKENFSFYFPFTTGIIISIILSVIFSLFFRR